jgi:uncharacterized membrane protein YkvA (DUF1232 family)
VSPKKSPQAPDAKIVSDVVESTKSKAEAYARDPEKAKKLIDQAVQKAKRQEKNKGPLADIWNYLTALFRLLRAYVRRQYTDVAWRSIVLITVAILYFVVPTDLIPDFIPAFGFLDDAAVIGFVIAQVKADLDNFLMWEAEQGEAQEEAPQ